VANVQSACRSASCVPSDDRAGAVTWSKRCRWRHWLTPDLTTHCLLLHGSIDCMAKEKATITLDRAKAAAARDLLGVGSTSEVIDVALDRLIRAERLRADVAAYQRVPTTEDEIDLASFGDISGIGDDTDWEALYADELS
jgi:hypothetical protein